MTDLTLPAPWFAFVARRPSRPCRFRCRCGHAATLPAASFVGCSACDAVEVVEGGRS